MTDYIPGKAPAEVERFNIEREAFWDSTVAENIARLDALPPNPNVLLDEIKLIESILLVMVKQRR